MQIVIDIPEGVYKKQRYLQYFGVWSVLLQKCFENSTPLQLDKIRAEIIVEMLYHSGTGEEVIQAYADGLKKGLDIIDKYTAESEYNDEDR